MSIAATVELPADEVGLAQTFDAVSDLTLRAERAVEHGERRPVPYVWIDCEDHGALAAALERDDSVAAAERIDAAGSRLLYRLEWRDETTFERLLDCDGATLLDVHGSGGRWTFRLRFVERESLSAAFERYESNGLSVSVRRIRESDGARCNPAGLTECQYETIQLALKEGYYEVPRRADLCALAEDIGVSHQALSERLRRAHGTLAEETTDVGL